MKKARRWLLRQWKIRTGNVQEGQGERMQEDEEKRREGQLKYRRAAEQTTLFLSLFILTLGIMFLTRDREELLKEEIVTLLGIVLNVSLAVEFSLREKWTFAVFAMLVAVAAGLVLGTQLFA